MAITSGTEDWKARTSSKSLEQGLTGTRVFNVYSDTPDETEANVYSAIPVLLGDYFPGTSISKCVDQRADRNTDDRTVWTVTCTYKSILNQTEQDRIDEPNPLDRPARINWSSRTIQTYPQKMLKSGFYRNFTTATFTDGSASNSANDPYDPPVDSPSTEWIATITKNVVDVPTWVMSYENAVNNADVEIDGRTVLKGCGKMEGIRISERLIENGVQFRQLSLNVIVRAPRPLRAGGTYVTTSGVTVTVPAETAAPEPWDIEILDEGLRTYYDGDKKWRNISLSGSGDVTKPVPLDGNGAAFNVTGDKIPECALTWVLLRPFNRKYFTVLPLT